MVTCSETKGRVGDSCRVTLPSFTKNVIVIKESEIFITVRERKRERKRERERVREREIERERGIEKGGRKL